MEQIQITLKRSFIATTQRQQGTLRGLGFRHREMTVLRPDSSTVRGMIRKVIHLVEISRPQKIAPTPKAAMQVEIVLKNGGETPSLPKKMKSSAKASKKTSAPKKGKIP